MNRKSCILFFMAIFTAQLACAQAPPDRLSKLAPQISKLVRLKWDDPRIVVDREHWKAGKVVDKAAEKAEQQKELKKEIDKYVAKGLRLEAAKQIAGQLLRAQAKFGTEGFFKELSDAAGAKNSGFHGGGKSRRWHSFGNDFQLEMEQNLSEKFTIRIIDTSFPFTRVTIEDHAKKGTQILIDNEQQILMFWQTTDGKIRFAISSPEHNEAVQTNDYDTFVVKHPELAKQIWSPLKELGIEEPDED